METHTTKVYEFPPLKDLTERFPENGVGMTTQQEMAYKAARKLWIANRADYYLDNAADMEMDVSVLEASGLPLIAFIKLCQKDPVEAGVKLGTAVYQIALNRAEADADEMSYDEIIRGL